MRPMLLAAGLLATALPAFAQDLPPRLSLEDALRIARANNPQFRQAQNELPVAYAQERQRLGSLLPGISASLGFSGSRSRTQTGSGDFGEVITNPTLIETTSSSATQGVGLSVTLFDGGASLGRLREGRANTRAAEARIDARANDLRAGVAARFYGALQAERSARVEEQLLVSAREQLAMTQRRFEIGSARREDVLGAEAGEAAQEQQVEQARGSARKARLLLLREMGVEREADFALLDELPAVFDPAALDAEALIATALSVSPRILEQEARVAASERSAGVARGARWPRITASAGFNRSIGRRDYEAFFELNPPNRSFTYGLSLSLPIFTGFQTSAAAAQADAALANAKEQLRGERLALEVELRSALIDLANAYRAVQLADRSLALGQERLELTQERYRVGGNVSFIELQNAIDGAARAERQAIDARFAFVGALVALESKVGREVRP